MKKGAEEYLEQENVRTIIAKHSGFASSFPIYLYSKTTEEQPIPQDELDTPATEPETVNTHLNLTDPFLTLF